MKITNNTSPGDRNAMKKIAIFDMDKTLLRESFIHTAAKRFQFSEALDEIVEQESDPFSRTTKIAHLLKGKSEQELLAVAASIAVTDNTISLVNYLKQNDFAVGLISDSYDCITNHFKDRFGFDFALSNNLEFSDNIATGQVKVPSFFVEHDNSICNHAYCKSHALAILCEHYDVNVADTLAIGDSQNDICLIDQCGIGISFCSTHPHVDIVADYVVKNPDFNALIPLLN